MEIRSITIVLVGVLSLYSDACLADQATTMVPPVGMVEELSSAGGSPIAPGPEGSAWFGSDGTSIDRITTSGLVNGEFAIPVIIAEGERDSEGPMGIVEGPKREMWFTERTSVGLVFNEGSAFVGKVTSGGKFTEFALLGYGEPTGIAPDATGDMWFTDEDQGAVGEVTSDGSISEYRPPTGSVSNMPIKSIPEDIAMGADGNMWFVDQGTNNLGQSLVGRITPSGIMSEFALPSRESQPGEIGLGSDGNMWVTEPRAGKIARVTPAGTISEFAAPNVGGDIALGADGNMWFTEGYRTNALGRITPAGIVTNFAPILKSGDGPTALASDQNGDLWFGGGVIGRIVIPLPPVVVGLPAISGEAVEGQVLSVSNGSWSNGPEAFRYQWQVCDGNGSGCKDLDGEIGGTHALTAADVGHTLRAIVTASNIGGSGVGVSSVSAIVQTPRPVELLEPPLPATKEFPPVVESAMTWDFGWARRYTIVESLIVHDVPAGGGVEVVCRGGGCPFARWHAESATRMRVCGKHRRCKAGRLVIFRGQASLAKLFADRHLKVGTQIVVNVLKAGWTGKSFLFTIRANKSPHTQVSCLGSTPAVLASGC